MSAILSVFEGNTFFFQWEVNLMTWLHSVIPQGGFIDQLMGILSMFGEELIMVGILGFIYWSLDKKYGEFIGVNLLTANLLNPMIKNIANRRRPYFDSEGIQCRKIIDADADKMDAVAQGFSFPSGHSSGAASLYPSLAVGKRKKWLIAVAVVIPFLVGISRVFLGVHYPTDVLVGWALGVGVVFLNLLLLTKIKNKYWVYLGYAIVGVAGMFYCKTNDYFTSYGMLLGFIAGVFFDEKVVKFQNTRVWWRMIIRVLFGGAIYLALNELIKLPVKLIPGGKEWLDIASAGNFAFRTVRYAIIIFVLIGIYPMLFKLGDKIFTKWGWLKKAKPETEPAETVASEKVTISEEKVDN